MMDADGYWAVGCAGAILLAYVAALVYMVLTGRGRR
jgi:hypothetical protein